MVIRSAREDRLVKSSVENGMRIDWDVMIEMDDGIALSADVFRLTTIGPNPFS